MALSTLYSRRFWVLFLLGSLLAVAAAFVLMENSQPVLKLDIRMSRGEAIKAAERFQQQEFKTLHTDTSAASFNSDRGLQNYVELEAGGIKVFQKLIPNIDAVTHYWRVRRFSEGQETELTTAYTPKGEFLSFWLKIPEKEPGAALEEQQARELAESKARQLMGARFDSYEAFETTHVKQITGRVDYRFVYQHKTLQVGEAKFRIDLRVAGDKVIGLDTFKFIPEGFDQRFAKLRSTNDHIARVANYLFMGLFGVLGLVGGGIWLHRQHQLQVKKAFFLGVFIAVGLTAAQVANIPLSWMGYTTTTPKSTFLMQQLFSALMIFISYAIFLTAVFTVAEGLTRMAFPSHLRFFELYKLHAAGSKQGLGRVLGAFGWTGFFLFYASVFSLLSSQYFGWWMPADTDVDPNILASWRPSLGPIFMALQAGTWEECLFRAVPLAIAVLLGKRFGHSGKIVIATLILQALVFGGGHANYPNLPGYSRVVELFIPALAFGLVYLRFGLVVGIITHFSYDLVLMSLPIWSAHDASLLVDKLLVLFFGLLPLGWVFLARWKQGQWVDLPEHLRNGVVQPIEHVVDVVAPKPIPKSEALSFGKWHVLGSLISAVVLLVVYLKPADIQWPKLQIDRVQALSLAQDELKRQGINLSAEWKSTLQTSGGWYQPMDFVWREANKESFNRLLGTYLDKPYWQVVFRRFEGPVEDRAESWSVYLNGDGSLHEIVHYLPEARAGAKLTREQATAKALTRIVALGWGDANALEEKSVEETVKPNRSDWKVTYFDKAAFNEKNGQAIIVISLAGDEVVGNMRSVHIPEEWNRAETEKASKRAPFGMVNQFAVLLIVMMGLSSFLKKYSGKGFDIKVTLPWLALVFISSIATDLLWFDQSIASFNTTSEYYTQVILRVAGILLGASLKTLLVFFVIQVLHAERPVEGTRLKTDLLLGGSFALMIAAAYSAIKYVLPSPYVSFPYFADISSYAPWITVLFNGLKGFFGKLMMLLMMIGIARFATKPWKWAVLTLLAAITLVMSALASAEPISAALNQLVTLVSAYIVLELINRHQLGAAFAMSGVAVALSQLGVSNALYETAVLHSLSSAALVLLMTFVLLNYWYQRPLHVTAKSAT